MIECPHCGGDDKFHTAWCPSATTEHWPRSILKNKTKNLGRPPKNKDERK